MTFLRGIADGIDGLQFYILRFLPLIALFVAGTLFQILRQVSSSLDGVRKELAGIKDSVSKLSAAGDKKG